MGLGRRERLARKRHRRGISYCIGGGITEWVRFKAGPNKPRCYDWDRLRAMLGFPAPAPPPVIQAGGTVQSREAETLASLVAEAERREPTRPRAPR